MTWWYEEVTLYRLFVYMLFHNRSVVCNEWSRGRPIIPLVLSIMSLDKGLKGSLHLCLDPRICNMVVASCHWSLCTLLSITFGVGYAFYTFYPQNRSQIETGVHCGCKSLRTNLVAWTATLFLDHRKTPLSKCIILRVLANLRFKTTWTVKEKVKMSLIWEYLDSLKIGMYWD